MKGLVYLLTVAAVMGLAFWAYQENYRTQGAQATAAEVAREIAGLRQQRAALRAEWAYLNRPERLADLAEMNFDRLGLLPMLPEQFVDRIHQIVMPPRYFESMSDPIEVSGTLPDAEDTRP